MNTRWGWSAPHKITVWCWYFTAIAAPTLSFFARGGLPYLLILTATVMVLAEPARLAAGYRRSQPLGLVSLGFVVFSACSIFYGVLPERAGTLSFYFLLGWLSWVILSEARMAPAETRRMLQLLLGTVVLWYAVYTIDAWKGYPIASDYAAKTGEVFGLHLFNRPLTFCALLLLPVMFWPGLAMFWRNAIGIGAAAILFTSTCETAMVSFAATLMGVVVVLLLPRPNVFLRAVVVMATVLVLGLPALSRQLPVESPDFMSALRFTSFQHRLFYWDNASRLTLKAPVLGYGGEASRYFSEIPDPRPQKVYVDGEAVYSIDGKLLGVHPHNGVIQLWLEYGAVGALFCLAGLWCWYRYWMSARDRRTQAARFALFSAVFVVMNAAWGAWQTDWIAIIILTAVFNTRLEDAVMGERAERTT